MTGTLLDGFAPGRWVELAACRSSWTQGLDVVAAELGELPGSVAWRDAVVAAGEELFDALREGEGEVAAAHALLGLGEGSTPAGDDLLMGALHALWALGRGASAAALVSEAPRRTAARSAAWLAAAAGGEVGPAWRRLLAALAGGDDGELRRAAREVRATGHTSGAFSLLGFLGAVGASPAARAGHSRLRVRSTPGSRASA